MRTSTSCALTLLAALALAGCASAPAPDAGADGGESTRAARPAYGTAGAPADEAAGPPERSARPGEVAVAVVGTPFLLAFKGVVCAASLVVAAPTSALIALTGDPYGEGLATLGDGVAHNCGPPWVLSP